MISENNIISLCPEKCQMGRLDIYKVELNGLQEKQASYSWVVDRKFFDAVVVEEVNNGKVEVELTVTKQSDLYHLEFVLKGDVIITCDRCLDDMTLHIETTGDFKVRLGDDYTDDGDIVVVPRKDGYINVSWYIYEFIALAIPIKHVHAPGKCNKGMMEKLNGHLIEEEDFEDSEESGDSEETDPRWDDLKKIKEKR